MGVESGYLQCDDDVLVGKPYDRGRWPGRFKSLNRFKISISLPTMKTLPLLIAITSLTELPLLAQTTTTTEKVVVVNPGVQILDSAQVRTQLSLAPKVVVLPAPPASTVKTTTTVIEEPGRPRRVYNTQRNVVIVEQQNQSYELPYVTLPVLFVKETADLLDTESRAALDQMAAVIQEISKTEPATRFDIEGHTSTEGTNEFNMTLSGARAQRVFDELTQRYGIPASVLTAHGYGENYPQFPNGNEVELQQDRRVLVVRVK